MQMKTMKPKGKKKNLNAEKIERVKVGLDRYLQNSSFTFILLIVLTLYLLSLHIIKVQSQVKGRQNFGVNEKKR